MGSSQVYLTQSEVLQEMGDRAVGMSSLSSVVEANEEAEASAWYGNGIDTSKHTTSCKESKNTRKSLKNAKRKKWFYTFDTIDIGTTARVCDDEQHAIRECRKCTVRGSGATTLLWGKRTKAERARRQGLGQHVTVIEKDASDKSVKVFFTSNSSKEGNRVETWYPVGCLEKLNLIVKEDNVDNINSIAKEDNVDNSNLIVKEDNIDNINLIVKEDNVDNINLIAKEDNIDDMNDPPELELVEKEETKKLSSNDTEVNKNQLNNQLDRCVVGTVELESDNVDDDDDAFDDDDDDDDDDETIQEMNMAIRALEVEISRPISTKRKAEAEIEIKTLRQQLAHFHEYLALDAERDKLEEELESLGTSKHHKEKRNLLRNRIVDIDERLELLEEEGTS